MVQRDRMKNSAKILFVEWVSMWWGPTLVAQPEARVRSTAGMRREREADGEEDSDDLVARRHKRIAPVAEVAPVATTPPHAGSTGGSRKRKDASATGFDLGVDANGALGWLPSETLLDHAMAASVSPESAPAQKRLQMDARAAAADASASAGDGRGLGGASGHDGGGGGHAAVGGSADDGNDDEDEDGNAMSWEGTGHFARVENEHDSVLLHDNPYSQSNFLLRTLTLDRLGRQRRK